MQKEPQQEAEGSKTQPVSSDEHAAWEVNFKPCDDSSLASASLSLASTVLSSLASTVLLNHMDLNLSAKTI
jgi:hypothetical protein